jgi:hypothetical protein
VDLSGASPTRLGRIDFVRWAGAYQAAWKLDPEVGVRSFVNADRLELAAQGRSRLDVTMFEGAGAFDSLGELNDIPGTIVLMHQTIGGNATFTLECDTAAVPLIALIPDVQFIEETPDVAARNSTTSWIVQSNTLNSRPIWDRGIHGEGQIVGIQDTNVRSTHCAFSDVVPFGPLHRKIVAYNEPLGASSHGTHVAGTVVGDSGTGDLRGIAYAGKLVYKTWPSFTETAMYANCLLHHTQGARIHTNSWGDDGTTSYNSLCRGIDDFQWDHEEDLILFAVTNQSSLKNPENAKNLLACGASQDTPGQANHCTAGAGPTADGRRKPEIFAPGCSTTSASSGSTCGTTQMTGTSMATPALAGCAMLVRQYFMDGFYPSGAATPSDALTPSSALLKAVMLNSTVDMTGMGGYPSNGEGWGRILLDNALYFPGDARRLWVEDVRNADGLSTGAVETHTIEVESSSQPLRVTLVFTEPAGAAGAGNPVINNLDLTVVAPDGVTMYRGNVFAGGASTTGGTADAKNNVEMVLVSSPAAGAWTVRVSAASVQIASTQGYALSASGDLAESSGCAPDLTSGAIAGQPGYGVPDGALNNEDFFYYLAQFSAGNLAVADLTTSAIAGQPGYGIPNGVINNEDFFYYLELFSSGC